MVRKYVRKTKQLDPPHDVLQKAIHDVIACEKSIRSIARNINVTPMRLCRLVKKAKANGDLYTFVQKGFKPVFNEEQESVLKSYLKTAANVYFGLSPKEVRILAFECASAFGVNTPVSWIRDKCAGEDWFSGFMKRNSDLSIRTPEATSMSRATSFNKENVKQFFTKLALVMDREKFEAHKIWNLDETAVTTVKKPRNVVAAKGVKQIGSMTSAERGQLMTMCVAVNAAGNSVPPILVFPRVKFHDHFVRDGPTGCIGAAHPSGWMTQDNFLIFMKHFVKHAKPTMDSKVLLLLDNHDSHLHIDVLNYAKENGVVMLSFPPHCSHKLQPLDRSVFGPFKRYLSTAQDAWMRTNPGKTMSIYDLPTLVRDTWPQAATPLNITKGFSVAGVYPFNDAVFNESEFLCSNVTDRPAPVQTTGPAKTSVPSEKPIPTKTFATTETTAPTDTSNASEIPITAKAPPPAETFDSVNTNEWDIIKTYVENLNRSLTIVPGDGHCLLHTFRRCLSEENIANISHDELCFRLKNEVVTNSAFYRDFAADRDMVKDIERYISNKEFNNDTVDMVLNILCNAFGVSAILYELQHGEAVVSAHAPGREGVVFRGDVHLAKKGHGGNSHFNAISAVNLRLVQIHLYRLHLNISDPTQKHHRGKS